MMKKEREKLSCLYDTLFGNRVSGSGGGANDSGLSPRVDGSLWQLVKDHMGPAWLGEIGGFIPHGYGQEMPGYLSGLTAYATNPDPQGNIGGSASLGRDFAAAKDLGDNMRARKEVGGGGQAGKKEGDGFSNYGLIKPILKGREAGYDSDTGLDINAPVGTPVLAASNGKVVYAEKGHTSWQRRDPATGDYIDTPYSILVELDNPITFKDGRKANYIWYTHLSKLQVEKSDGGDNSVPVKQGDVLGYSGTANDSPHLHFGVLTKRSQGEGEYFTPSEVREMLGIAEKDAW